MSTLNYLFNKQIYNIQPSSINNIDYDILWNSSTSSNNFVIQDFSEEDE